MSTRGSEPSGSIEYPWDILRINAVADLIDERTYKRASCEVRRGDLRLYVLLDQVRSLHNSQHESSHLDFHEGMKLRDGGPCPYNTMYILPMQSVLFDVSYECKGVAPPTPKFVVSDLL